MKADLHRQIANLSELILFFSGGLAVCFLVQAFPMMFLFQLVLYLVLIGYLYVDAGEDKRPFWLRTAALGLALLGGYWDLLLLFPLQVAVWLLAGGAAALLMVFMMQRWKGNHAKTQ